MTGLEPVISCLGSKRSTTELHPRTKKIIPNIADRLNNNEVVSLERFGLLISLIVGGNSTSGETPPSRPGPVLGAFPREGGRGVRSIENLSSLSLQ